MRVGSTMKEEDIEEDNSSEEDSLPHDKEIRRVVRPPDCKRHTLEMENLLALIHQKESQFKLLPKSISSSSVTPAKLYGSHDRETLMNELRTVKEEREKDFQMRKHLDQELRILNLQVQSKNDSCNRLQATLRYKTEQKIDNAVRRLQYQMNVQQLTIREERRMVSEIDALRRSKKNLKEYLDSRMVVDDLRTRQKTLRANRDACSRKINGCHSKEEAIKVTLDQLEAQAGSSCCQETKQHPIMQKEALKKEINELYNKKRELIASFNKEKNEYAAAVKDSRAEAVHQRRVEALKRAEERNAERQVQLKEIRKQRTVRSAVEEQLTLCHNLIGYLEKLLSSVSGLTDDHSSAQEEIAAVGESEAASINKDEKAGQFVRRKAAADTELVGLYAGLGRKGSKKGRKSRRSSAGQVPKKIVLHPDVVEQLLSLNLNVPGTATDIPRVLDELKDTKATLENPISVGINPDSHHVNPPSQGATTNVSTDSNSGNQDSKCVSSDLHRVNPETLGTNPKPMSPVTEDNSPPIFKIKSAKEDAESLSGQEKSEKKNGRKTVSNGDEVVESIEKRHIGEDTESTDQPGGVDKLEKPPSVQDKHGDNIKNTVLQTNTATCSASLKGENAAEVIGNGISEFLQEDAVLGQGVENGISCTLSDGAVEKSHITAASSVVDVNSVSDHETRVSINNEPIAVNVESLNDGECLSQSSALDSSPHTSCANGEVNCVENGESSPIPYIGSKAGNSLEPASRCCKDLVKENGLAADENVNHAVGGEMPTLSCEKCPA